MKLAIIQVLVISALIGVSLALGHTPTFARWGNPGLNAMRAAAGICGAAALAAVVPVWATLRWKPEQLGLAVFAGTGVRLLATIVLAVGYQVFTGVALRPFLTWLLILYFSLMVAETAIGIIAVRRQGRSAAPGG